MDNTTTSTLTKKDAAQLMGAALHLEVLAELMQGYSPEQRGLGEVGVRALGADLVEGANAILDVLERAGCAKQDIE